MRKRTTMSRVLGVLLSCVMVLTMAQIPSMAVHAEEGGVGGFVNRCYQVALGRAADPSGYADWTNQLTSGKSDGAYVAFGFVFSPEYTNSGKNNEAFVTDMYTLFLGRTPDEAGYRDWVGQLNAGADRQTIFAGFANSNEFYNICTSYGVTAGVHVPGYDRTQVNNVNMFVARMYKVCFNRLGDKDGQNDWVNRLLHGELSGTDCAHGFIYSKEYQNLGLSDEAYVENMYTAFMGRHSDPTGYNDWVSKLKAGYTRDEIFAGFANSNEFQNICNSYGIVRGSYTPTNVHSGNPTPTPTPTPTPVQNLMPNIDLNSVTPYVQEHGWRMKKRITSGGEFVYTYTGRTQFDYTETYYSTGSADGTVLTRCTYDSATNTITERADENVGNIHEIIKVTYKPLGGNLYECTMTAYRGDTIDRRIVDQVKVLDDGKRIIMSEAAYNKNNKISYKKVYSYDSQNRMVKCEAYDSSDKKSAERTYTYAGSTKKETYKRYYSDGTSKTEETTIVNEYDSHGNIVKETTTDSNGKKSVVRYEYEKY